MGRVIYLRPDHVEPGQLLRLARERAGLTHAAIAPLLAHAIGRPELSPATVRAWERGTVRVPAGVIEAAHLIASVAPPATATATTAAATDATDSSESRAQAVETVMQSFRDADRRVGGGFIYGSVIQYLKREIAPRLIHSDEELFDAAAALTEMAGWMAHDAGHDDFAQRHFGRALRFSSMTDDVELTAHIHASLSHLAMHQGRPREALQRAQAGLSLLNRHPHHPALTARLHAMQARALACLRRRADCARALQKAELALDRTHSGEPSRWASPFDHGSLAAEACQTMDTLGDLPSARKHAEQIISLRDGNHVRSRAFGQLRLASILVGQGEIDHACATAVDALQHSAGVSSGRVAQLIRSLHISLTAHPAAADAEPAVAALATALARPDPLRLLTTPRSLDT
jgi:Helix-turn-helix domain